MCLSPVTSGVQARSDSGKDRRQVMELARIAVTLAPLNLAGWRPRGGRQYAQLLGAFSTAANDATSMMAFLKEES